MLEPKYKSKHQIIKSNPDRGCKSGKNVFFILSDWKIPEEHPANDGNLVSQHFSDATWETAKDINLGYEYMSIISQAGAQTYRSITSTYYRKAQGVILMFDISNKVTFENVKRWNKQVDQKANKQMSKILIGNKIDLIDEGKVERQVSEQQITNFCIQNHMTFKETSALKGTHVKQTLVEIIEKIHQNRLDSYQGNQFTSILQINPNTTILIEPPLNNQVQTESCPKCC